MKIHDIKVKENEMTFTLKDGTESYANAIRRTIMSEVPIMAITEVDFYENNTSIFDEYIAHRLGLIPLTSDKTYKMPEECCEGKCGKCSTTATIDAKGPATVYSEELKFKDAKVEPVEKKIPIVKLTDGQNIRIEVKAQLGTGRQHARHQACICYYSKKKTKDEFDFTIETYGSIDPKKALEKAVEIIEKKAKELEKQIK